MQSIAQYKTKLETSVLNKFSDKERKLVTLNHLESPRFSEMNNEHKQQLAKCLVKLCYFVGIKEPLSIENLKMLVYYLVNQHPTFIQEELEQAFFMASSGDFGEIEHYQSFSPIYVSKIINLYTSKRSEAISKYRAEIERIKLDEEHKEKAKNYNAVEGCIEAICSQYDSFLKYEELKKDEDRMGLEETRGSIAIQLGQKLGLFKDYNPKVESASDFFTRIFTPLSKYEPEQTKIIIGKWVKTTIENISAESK